MMSDKAKGIVPGLDTIDYVISLIAAPSSHRENFGIDRRCDPTARPRFDKMELRLRRATRGRHANLQIRWMVNHMLVNVITYYSLHRYRVGMIKEGNKTASMGQV